MKRKMMLIVICLLIITVILISRMPKINNDNMPDIAKEYINKAQVMKQLSLVEYTRDECINLPRVIIYTDVFQSEWYDKYINAAFTSGYLTLDEEFKPMEELDYSICNNIIEYFKVNKDDLSFDVFDKKDNEKVSIDEWQEIYEKIIEDKEQVVYEEFIVVGTPANMSELAPWQMITENSTYYFEGIAVDAFIDYKVKALIRDDEIIYISEITDKSPTLKNLWIVDNKEADINVFINGYNRTYTAKNRLSEDISNVVGDLKLTDKRVTKIDIKPSIVNGKVLTATSEYIEIERYGKIYLSDEYKIYKIYNGLEMESTANILVGYDNTDFVVEKDKICAALIKGAIKAKNIRILVKTEGYKSLYHNEVILTADTAFTIHYDKKKKEYKANQVVKLNLKDKMLKSGRIKIETETDSGKIQLLSLNRSCGNPKYRGTIEVATAEEGLIVINELTLEEYLYAVLPSEMPTSYGLEALKVQAICARSYAFNQLTANLFGSYGAHVDDSTSSQVYNNLEENKESIQAVKETYGKVIAYENNVITAYYFSTSYGHTADSADVWQGSKGTPLYLTGFFQADGDNELEELDLSTEEGFKKFIKEGTYDVYDKDFVWYRWNTTISMENLKKSIDQFLAKRYNSNPDYIQTLDENGNYSSTPIYTVGNIKSITVKERGSSGIIKELVVSGKEGTIKVSGEYNIRVMLSPINDEIIKQDGSVSKGFSIMPSAFFYVSKNTADKTITFTGGGYGHGVGMSQNGVKNMVNRGYEFEEILKHYYRGAEIIGIY